MKNFDEQIAKAEEQIRQLNNKKKRLISMQLFMFIKSIIIEGTFWITHSSKKQKE